MNCGKKLPQPLPPMPELDEAVIRQVDPVLQTKEAAQLLKVSQHMIYELVRQQKIPHFKVGTRVRFRTQDLLNWVGTLDGPITTAG
jgi:excisionase family DNA binding protein